MTKSAALIDSPKDGPEPERDSGPAERGPLETEAPKVSPTPSGHRRDPTPVPAAAAPAVAAPAALPPAASGPTTLSAAPSSPTPYPRRAGAVANSTAAVSSAAAAALNTASEPVLIVEGDLADVADSAVASIEDERPSRPLRWNEPASFGDHSKASRQARAVASAAVSAARSTVRSMQRTAESVVSRGEAEDAEWQAVQDHSTLPALRASADGGDPLDDLTQRLDREADFYRGIGVRMLRPGPGRLLAILSAAVGLMGGAIFALASGIRAFFGAATAATGTEALALALLLALSGGMGLLLENERRRRADAALGRAEHAERRLERLAAMLALKTHDPKRFAEALTRLERESTR